MQVWLGGAMVNLLMPSPLRHVIAFSLVLLGFLPLRALVLANPAPAAAPAATPGMAPGKKVSVVVIPVHGEIAAPVFFIIRRGLKEAIEDKADVVVLDVRTKGGALATTFDIMDALGKFHGETIAFVDSEAMSAGAFISATTKEIWMTPEGIIGAAAPVSSTGQDIEATMKEKLVSYLTARMRVVSEGKGYRGQVVTAMIDSDYELKIGDKVLKPKGKLLSLTALEAAATYGNPPERLLSAGTAKNINDLLVQKYGAGNFVVRELKATWSERLAVILNSMSPVLMGLGLLSLFIEFKTPGFGFFGIAGIVLLAGVFFGSYVAGLSGHEPILFFVAGVLLVLLEVLFYPGIAVMAFSGILLMFGSLLWAMADIWPRQPIQWTGDVFVGPLMNLGLGIGLAVVLAVLLARYLPKGWLWDRMVLETTVSSSAQTGGMAPSSGAGLDALVGRTGVAATALHPGGQVEIGGRRYEARVEVGTVDSGSAVVVRGRTDFSLIVEKVS